MKPYRPANGTDGAIFMSRFCDQCERERDFRENDGDSCPIAAASVAFDVADAANLFTIAAALQEAAIEEVI
jgi:hypothetical protein